MRARCVGWVFLRFKYLYWQSRCAQEFGVLCLQYCSYSNCWILLFVFVIGSDFEILRCLFVLIGERSHKERRVPSIGQCFFQSGCGASPEPRRHPQGLCHRSNVVNPYNGDARLGASAGHSRRSPDSCEGIRLVQHCTDEAFAGWTYQ